MHIGRASRFRARRDDRCDRLQGHSRSESACARRVARARRRLGGNRGGRSARCVPVARARTDLPRRSSSRLDGRFRPRLRARVARGEPAVDAHVSLERSCDRGVRARSLGAGDRHVRGRRRARSAFRRHSASGLTLSRGRDMALGGVECRGMGGGPSPQLPRGELRNGGKLGSFGLGNGGGRGNAHGTPGRARNGDGAPHDDADGLSRGPPPAPRREGARGTEGAFGRTSRRGGN
jgi:hypothetical protein